MSDETSIGIKESHQQFVGYLKSQGKSNSTVLGYGKDIDQMVQFLTSADVKLLSQVSEEYLKNFVEDLKKKNYTAKSVSRKINSIKTFYRFAEREHLVSSNPSMKLEYPKYENKLPRVLSPLEYRALRDAAREDIRIYAIIELFLQTGLRISEVANLRLEDVKEDSLFIRPMEGREERMIPLNKPANGALQNYLKIRPKTDDNHVFITKTGKQLLIRNIRNSIDRYFRIAGISAAKVNDLRHTWIAHHLQAGTSLLLVSKIAGHKRLSTTERYLELVKEKQDGKTKLEEL